MERLFCTVSVKIYTEYLKIIKNITCSAVTLNTKEYLLFLLEISVKNIYKVIQYIFFEDLHINIGNRYSDIVYYTTIIYEDSALGFRLGPKTAQTSRHYDIEGFKGGPIMQSLNFSLNFSSQSQ